MSPRPPRRRGRPAAAGPPRPAAAIRLPASGLAREILADIESQERQERQEQQQRQGGETASPAAPSAAGPAPGTPTEWGTLPSPGTPPARSTPTETGTPPAPGTAPQPTAPGTAPEPTASSEPTPPRGANRIFSFAEILERRAAPAPEVPVERPQSWVTFELAGERYALPVARIQEITRAHGITRVPHAPPPVRGIANLRGRVLVVVDLRLRLGLPPAAAGERSRILVVSARERALGLLVDAAHQVVGLLPSRIEPPPPDLMDERSAYLAGVVQLDDSLVIALDVDQLLLVPEDAENQSQPEAGGPS